MLGTKATNHQWHEIQSSLVVPRKDHSSVQPECSSAPKSSNSFEITGNKLVFYVPFSMKENTGFLQRYWLPGLTVRPGLPRFFNQTVLVWLDRFIRIAMTNSSIKSVDTLGDRIMGLTKSLLLRKFIHPLVSQKSQHEDRSEFSCRWDKVVL